MFFSNENKAIENKYGLANIYVGTSISKHYEKIVREKLKHLSPSAILFSSSEDELVNQAKKAPLDEIYILFDKEDNDSKPYVHGTAIPMDNQIDGYDDNDSPIYNANYQRAISEIENKRLLQSTQLYEQVAQYQLGMFFCLSHAIAIKIDNKNKTIFYIDSYGNPIPTSLQTKLVEKFPNYKIICNEHALQHPADHANCFIFATENLVCLSKKDTRLFNPAENGYIETIESSRKQYATLINDLLEEDLKQLRSKALTQGTRI